MQGGAPHAPPAPPPSALEAFQTEVVVSAFPRRIDSLCVWEGHVVAGLQEGSLLLFQRQAQEEAPAPAPGPAGAPPSAQDAGGPKWQVGGCPEERRKGCARAFTCACGRAHAVPHSAANPACPRAPARTRTHLSTHTHTAAGHGHAP